MNIAQAIIVFAISWWLVFLPALSIGVQNQYESGTEFTEGSEEGAPVSPMLGKKAIWATIGATIMTSLFALGVTIFAS